MGEIWSKRVKLTINPLVMQCFVEVVGKEARPELHTLELEVTDSPLVLPVWSEMRRPEIVILLGLARRTAGKSRKYHYFTLDFLRHHVIPQAKREA